MILLKALLHWVRAIDLHVVEAKKSKHWPFVPPNALSSSIGFAASAVLSKFRCRTVRCEEFHARFAAGQMIVSYLVRVQKIVAYNVTRLYTIRLWFWRPYWSFVRCWALQKKLSGCDWRDFAILARTTVMAQSMPKHFDHLELGRPEIGALQSGKHMCFGVWVDAVVMDLFGSILSESF